MEGEPGHQKPPQATIIQIFWLAERAKRSATSEI